MRSLKGPAIRIVAVAVAVACAAAPVSAQVTEIESVSSSGEHGNASSLLPSISADGRIVAFQSLSSNLAPGGSSGAGIFVRDRWSATTERASVAASGTIGDGDSIRPSVSGDGGNVAFEGTATNLVQGAPHGQSNIYVRNRASGTTELASLSSLGVPASASSRNASISGDGRYVAFESDANNLVFGDNNGCTDVFVRDRQTGTTERVSVDSSGVQGDASSTTPVISGDGRFVAFVSEASNLVPGGILGNEDVYVHDRVTHATELVSVSLGGTPSNGLNIYLSISPDGRFVTFTSYATNLVANDVNNQPDVFLRDRQLGVTELISVDSSGNQADDSSDSSSVSADGRFVAFGCLADNLVPADFNGLLDVFVRDRQLGTTERVSVTSNGMEGNGDSRSPALSGDGRFVAFSSIAHNFAPPDLNNAPDVFVRDRVATGFTSTCDAGASGVIACPCSNPPSASGRGCDNSAATGGASISPSGIAYLSMDSLYFMTSGETPTAMSVLVQCDANASSGVVFGQGVRCGAGSQKRLFVKDAIAGGITAPDFGAFDITISSRSAQLGDVISAGEMRWYFVYYRDAVVLGGCPSTSMFNATQTGQVLWSF
jgi:Tol biopolymer transport system component